VEPMETTYLTIADAVELSGRSPSTIRRLIRTIADDVSHPDRLGVEPTPEAVEAFKKKGENFTWKIREDILQKHLKSAPKEEKKRASERVSEPTADILQILQKELDLKSQQIEKQWEVIHALNDRLREGNILMGSLQQRLALPGGDKVAPAAMAETSKASTEGAKKPSTEKEAVAAEASSAPPAKKAAKKGLLGWMFR
jgi:hypothetical protein